MSQGSLDLGQQTRFALDVSAFVAKAKGNAQEVVNKVAVDVLSSVVLKSPVDTGRFRGNWNVSLGGPDTFTSDATDKIGTQTIAAGAAAVEDARPGQTIFITNSLPYAERLEYGHSKKAPNGMVRITLSEFQSYIDRAAAGMK